MSSILKRTTASPKALYNHRDRLHLKLVKLKEKNTKLKAILEKVEEDIHNLYRHGHCMCNVFLRF